MGVQAWWESAGILYAAQVGIAGQNALSFLHPPPARQVHSGSLPATHGMCGSARGASPAYARIAVMRPEPSRLNRYRQTHCRLTATVCARAAWHSE